MTEAPPRPAAPSATVMLVRDGEGLEVLMVRRHHQIEFASGALVFPGGKVEPGDGDPAWGTHAAGWDALDADERTRRVCAVREAFEESGILIARRADGDWYRGTEAAAEREPVAAGSTPFLHVVRALGLRLDLAAMARFAHWITPAVMPKRFDTTFYLMTAPADQIAACDGYETVDAEWITAAEALRLAEAGERTIVFPTRLNLRLLAGSGSVDAALDAARARTVVTVEPDVERRDGRMIVSIPPDAGYGAVEPQSP